MANTIRIKRRASGGAGAPSSLANAELAYNEVDDVLYYGKGNSGGAAVTIEAIAGVGAYMALTGNQTIAGTKTFSSPIAGSITGTAANVTGTVAVANGGTGQTSYIDGQLLIGNSTGNTLSKATLTAGSGVTIVNGPGTITISATTGGTGTVTSVALSLPSIFTVSGSPVTTSGTLTGTLASQSANTVFAAPNGSAGTPTFRALVAADIPTLTASKISDFDTQVRTNRLDQMAAPTASVSLNSQKITNLATPTADTDAATKGYVDTIATGLDPKASCRAATTANITLSAPQTIDGVSVIAGDRVLVKNQTTTSANGIYVVAAGAWTRSTDMDSWAEVPNAFTFIEEGTTQADTGWVCTSNAGGTLGSTAITFVQFSGAGTYTAGTGLTLSGSTFSITNTAVTAASYGSASSVATFTVNAQGQLTAATSTSIAIAATQVTSGTLATARGGTGLSSFTSGGAMYATSTSALTTGTLPVTAGGTGVATLTGIVKANGTSAFSAAVAGTDYLDPNSTIDGGTF